MKRFSLHHRQHGQALVEFIVMALVLVPLFLLIPMIAKYQDMAHATLMASRYVAFAATTRNDGMGDATFEPADQLAGEVRRRFMSNSDAPIKTGDVPGDFLGHQNLFWRDQHGNALIAHFDSDVSVSFGAAKGADHSDGFSAASDGRAFNTLPLNVREALELKANGVYSPNVTIKVANLDSAEDGITKAYDEFRDINLSITRHTSLVVDSWVAAAPEQVEQRIDHATLFPGRSLSSLKSLVGLQVAMGESPACFPALCSPVTAGPKLGELEFWRDVVPADRKR